MRFKRFFVGSFLLVQLLSVFVLFNAPKAGAVPADDVDISLRFTSAARIVATITYNDKNIEIIMRDGDPMDKNMRYEATGDNHCSGSLTILESDAMRNAAKYNKEPRIITATTQGSNPRASTDINFRPDSNSTCQEIGNSGAKIEVEVTNREAGRAFYAYTSPNQISRVDQDGSYVFTRSAGDPNLFTRDSDTDQSECRDFIRVLTGGSTYQLYDIRNGTSSYSPGPAMPEGCRYNTDGVTGSSSYNFGVDGVFNEKDRHDFATSNRSLVGLQNIDNDPTNDDAPPGGSPDAVNEDNSCESKSGAMGWILCPIVNLIDGALNFVDSQVNRLLEVDENKYTDPGLEAAWKVTRNLAYLILVPVVLVMVISTALGFEFVSAYTVKRALPRLVAATIFIALSWSIVTFMVTLSNNVGAGVLGIMEAPFSDRFGPACQADLNLGCFFEVNSGDGGDNILHTILFLPQAAASIVGLIIFIILFGATMLTSIVIGFLVLLARQMFILALMILAPLAILAWIFPGNDKLWKSWWSIFTKLLIMFPLIMGLIGIGRIFATILKETDASGPEGAILNPIMKLAAYMLPYALIPLTFRFAGGTFATLAGFADDKSKGLFDRQRAKRQQRAQVIGNRFKSGDVRGPGGASLGRLTSAVAAGPKGWTRRGGIAASREDALTAGAAVMAESNAIMQRHKNNDKVMTAIANRAVAQKNLDAALASGDTGSAAAWTSAMAIASRAPKSRALRSAAAQQWANSGYNFSDGEEGYNELAQTMASITGATLTRNSEGKLVATGANAGAYASAMNSAQFGLKNAQRFDLAGINDGQGYDYWTGVGKANGYSAGQAKPASHTAGLGQLTGTTSAKASKTGVDRSKMSRDIINRLQSGELDSKHLLTHHENLLEARQSATGSNRAEIDAQLQVLSGVRDGLNSLPSDGIPDDVVASRLQIITSMDDQRRQSRRPPNPADIE